MHKVMILSIVIKNFDDVSLLETQIEDLYVKHHDMKVTWLSAAGNTFNMLTAICEWNE